MTDTFNLNDMLRINIYLTNRLLLINKSVCMKFDYLLQQNERIYNLFEKPSFTYHVYIILYIGHEIH